MAPERAGRIDPSPDLSHRDSIVPGERAAAGRFDHRDESPGRQALSGRGAGSRAGTVPAVDHFGRPAAEEGVVTQSVLSRSQSLSHFRALSRFIPLMLMIAILLLSAAVRFHRLGAQSLWNDEGATYDVAVRGLPDIAQAVAADVHVPVYFWGMHLWIGLAGETEFALRLFSALASLVGIALAYALGKRLYGPVAG